MREQNNVLNLKKCKEMQTDFRRNGTDLSPINVGEKCFTKVKSYKLLGVWFDDDLSGVQTRNLSSHKKGGLTTLPIEGAQKLSRPRGEFESILHSKK